MTLRHVNKPGGLSTYHEDQYACFHTFVLDFPTFLYIFSCLKLTFVLFALLAIFRKPTKSNNKTAVHVSLISIAASIEFELPIKAQYRTRIFFCDIWKM